MLCPRKRFEISRKQTGELVPRTILTAQSLDFDLARGYVQRAREYRPREYFVNPTINKKNMYIYILIIQK